MASSQQDHPFTNLGDGWRQQRRYLKKWMNEVYDTATQAQKDDLLKYCWESPKIQNVDVVKFLVIFGANSTNLLPVESLMGKWDHQQTRRKPLEYYEFQEFLSIAQHAWEMEHSAPLIFPGTTNLDTQKLFALSLDGGGIRGLVTAMTLRFVSNRIFGDEKIKDRVNWIAGTSTGAIIALGLTKQQELTPSGCMNLYWNMKNKVFLKKNCALPVALPSTPRKQSENLQALLKQEFKEDTLKSREAVFNQESYIPRVSIVALCVSYEPAFPHVFRNYMDPSNGEEVTDLKLWRVARASSAAPPPYFLPCVIDEVGEFMDGGIGGNDPSIFLEKEMLAFTKKEFETNGGTSPSVHGILSVGTGKPSQKMTKKFKKSYGSFWSTMKTAYYSIKIITNVATGVPDDGISDRAVIGSNGEAYKYSFYRVCPNITDVDLNDTDDILLIDMLWETVQYIIREDTLRIIDGFAETYDLALRQDFNSENVSDI